MNREEARIWALLRQHGLATGDAPPAAEPASFWFVRIMLGIGGWLGAVFLLAFVAAGLSFIVDKPAASFVAGAAVCAAAAALLRARVRSDFLPHFGFAMSLAGQALMAWGLERGIDGPGTAFAIALQQVVLFFAVPNVLHRTWTAGTAAIAAAYALHDLQLGPYAPFLLTAGAAWIWLKELDLARWAAAWRAAGYGVAIAALVATATIFAWDAGRGKAVLGGEASMWIGAFLGGAVLIATAALLLRREGVAAASSAGRGALLIAAILGAAAIKAPGLAPATVILVVGFANGNRVLTSFGVVALLGFLSHYYYSLQTTLLEKSALLAATGIALLLARLVLSRRWPHPRRAPADA